MRKAIVGLYLLVHSQYSSSPRDSPHIKITKAISKSAQSALASDLEGFADEKAATQNFQDSHKIWQELLLASNHAILWGEWFGEEIMVHSLIKNNEWATAADITAEIESKIRQKVRLRISLPRAGWAAEYKLVAYICAHTCIQTHTCSCICVYVFM